MSEETVINTTGRNNCGGRCVIRVHMKNGRIDHLTTEHADEVPDCVPLCACARGMNYHKTYLREDRLRYPMKRVGERGEGKFERISWAEAVDTIAKEWIRIRDTYGPGSRYVMYATGVSALLRGSSLAKRLLSLDGGFLDYYNSYSTACIRQATILMYGTGQNGVNPKEWLSSDFIVLMGHNPKETVFSSETMYYLRMAKQMGIPVVCIDPRKSDTVLALDAEWIPVRPATDAALTDALAYVLYTEKLYDQAFLDRCCIGFDREHMPEGVDPKLCYLDYLLGTEDGVPKTPEWAERITGIGSEVIRSLGLRIGHAKHPVIIQGYGAQRHAYGEQSTRGGILLACMTGNIGVHGGWASGTCDYNVHQFPSMPHVPNPYRNEIPTYLWTEAVEHGHLLGEADGVKGQGQPMADVKMIFNLAGNCLINQHGDINRTAAILRDTSKCEFIVCSDLFMTASAKFADILLPGVSMFETENITMPWIYGEFIGFNNQCIEPLWEGRFEYDWLREVADRLGLEKEFSQGRTKEEWLAWCYDDLRRTETELPDYETFKKAAIYRYKNTKDRITFEDECRDPEHHPFPTPSGKIEIFAKSVLTEKFRDPFPPIPRYVEPPEGPEDPLREKYPIQLIGWHTKKRCHSIHDNNPDLQKLDPQMLWIHPEDAADRGIREGDEVLVWNDRGRIRIPAHITDRIVKGAAALSQGAWFKPDADGTDTGGSINVLTSLRPTPYARGNGQHTALVQVERIAGKERP